MNKEVCEACGKRAVPSWQCVRCSKGSDRQHCYHNCKIIIKYLAGDCYCSEWEPGCSVDEETQQCHLCKHTSRPYHCLHKCRFLKIYLNPITRLTDVYLSFMFSSIDLGTDVGLIVQYFARQDPAWATWTLLSIVVPAVFLAIYAVHSAKEEIRSTVLFNSLRKVFIFS